MGFEPRTPTTKPKHKHTLDRSAMAMAQIRRIILFWDEIEAYFLLCITTSERVLRTALAGQNKLSDVKTTFSVTNGTK